MSVCVLCVHYIYNLMLYNTYAHRNTQVKIRRSPEIKTTQCLCVQKISRVRKQRSKYLNKSVLKYLQRSISVIREGYPRACPQAS